MSESNPTRYCNGASDRTYYLSVVQKDFCARKEPIWCKTMTAGFLRAQVKTTENYAIVLFDKFKLAEWKTNSSNGYCKGLTQR